MSLSAKYHIADGLRLMSAHFGTDVKAALIRAGLPADFADGPNSAAARVTAQHFHALWDALGEATPVPDLPKALSDLVLGISLDSSGLAFFSSPSLRVGLQRKALFKPLVMPVRFEIRDAGHTAEIVAASALPGEPLPPLIGWFEMVFLLAICRKATAAPITPVSVELAAPWPGWAGAEAFFGCPVRRAGRYALVLEQADLDRPLVARSDAGWRDLDEGMAAQWGAGLAVGSTAERVRRSLLDGLPGGQAGADQIARNLGLSKRSLQRRLAEEGTQFKEILEDTRRALALSYLQRHDLGMHEIALLLGFRDASSFFRAFKGWTGQTPSALRGKRPLPLPPSAPRANMRR